MELDKVWDVRQASKSTGKWSVYHLPSGLRVGDPSAKREADKLCEKLEETVPGYSTPGASTDEDTLVQKVYYSIFKHRKDSEKIRYEDKRPRCPTDESLA